MYKHTTYDMLREYIPETHDFPYTEEQLRIKVLRPYQVIGKEWLKKGKRKWLTDKPGLGKTLQAIEAAQLPCLVVAPTYLCNQWHAVLQEQRPFDTIVLCTGDINRFKRQEFLDESADWYIVNKEMMRVDELGVPIFNIPDCKTVILDEAHHFRNRTAKQSIGVALYTSNLSRRVYNLTATPMWKDASDLWMQLHITQPEIFSSYRDFIDLFCVVDDTPYGPKILGVKKRMRAELRKLLTHVALGRDYKEVGRHLPKVIKNTFKSVLPKELMEKYIELKDFFRLQMEEEDEGMFFTSYIAVLHSLRAFTNWHGKQEDIKNRMEDVGKPGVVYTWYKDVAYSLGDVIPNSVVLTGDIKPEERIRLAYDSMRRGKNIIATMPAMSEGVNLYDYRYVAFYECDWPPGRNEQTLGRVVRDRNDDGTDIEPVIVDYFMCVDTVDEQIYKVSQRREASIRDVMNAVLA